MSKKVKIFAIVVIAIAIAIYIGSATGNKKATVPDSPLTSSVLPQSDGTDSGTDTAHTGEDFSTLLSSVRSITIDTSIFENPAFKALRDHSVMLGTDSVGRDNPFAPIGTDAPAGAQSIQTLQPGKVTSASAEFSAQVSVTTTAPVKVVFQYGTSDIFGSATTPVPVTKSGAAFSTAKNLEPDTTYYVQAVLVTGSTTMLGNTMNFTTSAAPGN